MIADPDDAARRLLTEAGLGFGLYELRPPPDLVKRDLEVACAQCGAHLCDAEPGDDLHVLGRLAAAHTPVCGAGQ